MTDPTPLLEPADGVPPVIATDAALTEYVEAVAHADGPVAVDAERASGYRYGQRAYLVQVRRLGAGTALIDPIACPDLSGLSAALADAEWVLHAANQDLPCLSEVGLVPQRLFDTELAGRLLGRERVGLAAIVEQELGLTLAKEHSAVDWSTRPLHEDWLRYAALDVEVLVELRDALERDLVRAGKAEWANEEFEALRNAPPPAPRADPWRRTSGSHAVRDPRQLAVMRSLWLERDAVARERDIAPGRVLPDRAIVAAATALPKTQAALGGLREYSGRGAKRRLARWWGAVADALALDPSELPPRRGPSRDTLPPPRAWGDRNPEAAERLRAVRATVRTLGIGHSVPQENLLAPDTQRRLAWEPPEPASDEAVASRLAALGARPWQISLVGGPLAAAVRDPGSVPEPETEAGPDT